MASLVRSLPLPRGNYEVLNDPVSSASRALGKAPIVHNPPGYLQREGFVPRSIEDFGDGGSFPEIHVAQYPLELGRPEQKLSTTLALTTGADGNVNYDAVAKQGRAQGTVVYSKFSDIVERSGQATEDTLLRPGEAEQEETMRRTREKLQGLLEGKIAAAKPITIPGMESQTKAPEFLRYTANPNAPGYNPAAKQRVIRLVEAQVDPMQPPKFKHKKVARGPPSPPVPVLHSPPRKLTVKDQQAWKIPPCVSNWKNAKGYTIPLDKRIAADGRGLQETTINDQFANFSEALYIAERKAREEVRARASIYKKLNIRENEQREAELRDTAAKARMERSGILAERDRVDLVGNEDGAMPVETDDDRVARTQRDRLRVQRKKERESELRLERAGKRTKMLREEQRDVSEKIALGLHTGSALAGEDQFDSRLYNQSQGLDSGFGAEDEYNVYSKAMFDKGSSGSLYRPRTSKQDIGADADEQMVELSNVTARFKPDKGFAGADAGAETRTAARDAPVQFERDEHSTADPFGLEQFMTESNKARRALDAVGSSSGGLAAGAGGGRGDDYENEPSTRDIKFKATRT